ncbi:histidine phosphatase family protein, partial [candidate division WWE3 bacterium]|nr:histidine phosphatase family protein [candidate division WWE3 bacterium]
HLLREIIFWPDLKNLYTNTEEERQRALTVYKRSQEHVIGKLHDLMMQHQSSNNFVLVTHGNVIRSLIAHENNISPEEMIKIETHHTGITELDYTDHGTFTITRTDDIKHLKS